MNALLGSLGANTPRAGKGPSVEGMGRFETEPEGAGVAGTRWTPRSPSVV